MGMGTEMGLVLGEMMSMWHRMVMKNGKSTMMRGGRDGMECTITIPISRHPKMIIGTLQE